MTGALLPRGSYPVMLVPFTDAFQVDLAALDRVVDWYLQAGSAGLFPNSRSSEMEYLTQTERETIARRVVERVDGRAAVVSTGTFGRPVKSDIDSIRAMADTGVDAVVIITNHLAPFGAPDAEVLRNLEEVIAGTEGVDLGFYECPTPYKRLLTAEMYTLAAQSNRFVFHKDTSHDLGVMAERIALGRGTRMRLYNAQTSTIVAGLDIGAHGHSGIAANLFPDLVAWLCESPDDDGGTVDAVQNIVAIAEGLIGPGYPTSAKQFIHVTDGVDLALVSRMEGAKPRDAHGYGPLRAIAALAEPYRTRLATLRRPAIQPIT